VGKECLRHQENAGQVGFDNLVPGIEGHIDHVASFHDAGVIDQDIRDSETAHDGLDHRFDGNRVALVATERAAPFADVLRGVLEARCVARSDRDRRAGLVKGARYVKTDSAASTGDDGDFSGEVSIEHGCLLLSQ